MGIGIYLPTQHFFPMQRLITHDGWDFPFAAVLLGFQSFTCFNARGVCLHVKNRFAQILCLVAVFQLLGGHWAILQTTAWVGMIIEYSAADGVQVGLSKTFDGEHPCELCKSIAKNTGAERKHVTQVELGKINSIAPANATVLCPPARFWYQAVSVQSAFGVSRPPLVPPPRDLIG
jgi:hypothetical protein